MTTVAPARAGDHGGNAVDVVVAGAGGCGLMAALVAARGGARVLVLEKTDGPGGGTALSHRGLRAAGTRYQHARGIRDTPELYAEEILRRNGGRSDPAVTLALARVSARMVHVLADVAGVDFDLDDFAFGQAVPRSHRWKQPVPITALLFDAVRHDPRVDMRFATSVRALTRAEDGAVAGAVTGDGTTIVARRTILATGGFGASRRMLRRYLPDAHGVAFPGHAGSTGDGIRMGLAVGGRARHMDAFQPYPAHVGPGKRGVPPGVILAGGIVVDASGRRFVDETAYPGGLAAAMLRLPGARAYVVFDEAVFADNTEHTGDRSIVAMRDDGVLRSASSPAGLATVLGVDADGLAATVTACNAAVGEEDRFGRRRERPLRAPFHGVPITVALYHTQGGLEVTPDGQVRRADGSVVPNLYAGGGAAAGVSGDGLDGYLPGNGLLASRGFGMLAAEHALDGP